MPGYFVVLVPVVVVAGVPAPDPVEVVLGTVEPAPEPAGVVGVVVVLGAL